MENTCPISVWWRIHVLSGREYLSCPVIVWRRIPVLAAYVGLNTAPLKSIVLCISRTIGAPAIGTWNISFSCIIHNQLLYIIEWSHLQSCYLCLTLFWPVLPTAQQFNINVPHLCTSESEVHMFWAITVKKICAYFWLTQYIEYSSFRSYYMSKKSLSILWVLLTI